MDAPRPRVRNAGARLLLVALALTLAGCRTGRLYPEPAAPRFADLAVDAPPSDGWRDTIRIVSFNVEYGQEVDSALAVLQREPDLGGADLVLLQEMDEHGTRRIAEALGMAWVYYPAVYRYATERNFGNAVLSRWPIEADTKLILPHRAIFGRTQRTATVATVRIGRLPVRVYSVHLATPVNMALRDRRDQMRAVLADARTWPRVVIGGDFNDGRIPGMAAERGYAWPTEDGPRTVFFGRWDHIVVKGLDPLDDTSGTVLDTRTASDHRPVWAAVVVR
ncbi:MAG: endonuclease/exonuclease/phosphatase family protein [Longimicrobiales bacterium]